MTTSQQPQLERVCLIQRTLSSQVRIESRNGRPTGVSPLDRPLMMMPRLLNAFLIWAVSRRRWDRVSRWDGVRPSASPPRSWRLRGSEDRSFATTSRSEPARSTICTRLSPVGVWACMIQGQHSRPAKLDVDKYNHIPKGLGTPGHLVCTTHHAESF